ERFAASGSNCVRRIPFLVALVVTVTFWSLAACSGSAPSPRPVLVPSSRANASPPASPLASDAVLPATVGQTDAASASQSDREVEPAELRRAAFASVFFGHQSVGGNVLKGGVALYEDANLPAPLV